MKTLFEYSNYKKYLHDYMALKPDLKRGGRIRLAKAIGCQPAFISQVLGGDLQFSLEQAEAATRFLGHNQIEKKYFLLLVQTERAGTSELRSYLTEELSRLKKESMVLTKRLLVEEEISEKDQSIYYSKWFYSAIHMLITIEEFSHSENKIASRLNLDLKTLQEALQFLKSTGLIEEHKGFFCSGKKRLHLSGSSHLISHHHSNWRIKAISALATEAIEDLHYSSVITISKDDAMKIKEALIQKIAELKKVIKDSKEEEIYSLCFDFFKL